MVIISIYAGVMLSPDSGESSGGFDSILEGVSVGWEGLEGTCGDVKGWGVFVVWTVTLGFG